MSIAISDDHRALSETAADFLTKREARGAARPFGGRFYRWSYEPLRETERAALEIVRRLEATRRRRP